MGHNLYDAINGDSPLFWATLTKSANNENADANTMSNYPTAGGGTYSADTGNPGRGPSCRSTGSDANLPCDFDGSSDDITWVTTGTEPNDPIIQTSSTKEPMSFEIYFHVDTLADTGEWCLWSLRSNGTVARHWNMRIKKASGVKSIQRRIFDTNSGNNLEWCEGRWNQVIVTYDPDGSAGNAELYLNGAHVASPGGYGRWSLGGTYRIAVGRDALYDYDGVSPEQRFDGRLAHFAWYDYELSATQVRDHWEACCYGCGQPVEQVIEHPLG